MRGMCVWLREISPGKSEMATSGGEREERHAWTHDRKWPLGSLTTCKTSPGNLFFKLATPADRSVP